MSPDLSSSLFVWLNGDILPLHEARISPLDRGFLYGDGLFETMRGQDGRILYLTEHLERLHRSVKELRIPPVPSIDWRDCLGDLLRRNDLELGAVAVKIIVTRGTDPTLGLPEYGEATVCMTARRYHPPSTEAYWNGWKLHVFNGGFAPPLGKYKTLNYLYYLAARQVALDSGGDEALILDTMGNVADTAAGSLMVKINGQWLRPASPQRLQGITVELVAELFKKEGGKVHKQPLTMDDLLSAETVWVLNSLMGVMPVNSIEDHSLPALNSEEAVRVREVLFENES